MWNQYNQPKYFQTILKQDDVIHYVLKLTTIMTEHSIFHLRTVLETYIQTAHVVIILHNLNYHYRLLSDCRPMLRRYTDMHMHI